MQGRCGGIGAIHDGLAKGGARIACGCERRTVRDPIKSRDLLTRRCRRRRRNHRNHFWVLKRLLAVGVHERRGGWDLVAGPTLRSEWHKASALKAWRAWWTQRAWWTWRAWWTRNYGRRQLERPWVPPVL